MRELKLNNPSLRLLSCNDIENQFKILDNQIEHFSDNIQQRHLESVWKGPIRADHKFNKDRNKATDIELKIMSASNLPPSFIWRPVPSIPNFEVAIYNYICGKNAENVYFFGTRFKQLKADGQSYAYSIEDRYPLRLGCVSGGINLNNNVDNEKIVAQIIAHNRNGELVLCFYQDEDGCMISPVIKDYKPDVVIDFIENKIRSRTLWIWKDESKLSVESPFHRLPKNLPLPIINAKLSSKAFAILKNNEQQILDSLNIEFPNSWNRIESALIDVYEWYCLETSGVEECYPVISKIDYQLLHNFMSKCAEILEKEENQLMLDYYGDGLKLFKEVLFRMDNMSESYFPSTFRRITLTKELYMSDTQLSTDSIPETYQLNTYYIGSSSNSIFNALKRKAVRFDEYDQEKLLKSYGSDQFPNNAYQKTGCLIVRLAELIPNKNEQIAKDDPLFTVWKDIIIAFREEIKKFDDAAKFLSNITIRFWFYIPPRQITQQNKQEVKLGQLLFEQKLLSVFNTIDFYLDDDLVLDASGYKGIDFAFHLHNLKEKRRWKRQEVKKIKKEIAGLKQANKKIKTNGFSTEGSKLRRLEDEKHRLQSQENHYNSEYYRLLKFAASILEKKFNQSQKESVLNAMKQFLGPESEFEILDLLRLKVRLCKNWQQPPTEIANLVYRVTSTDLGSYTETNLDEIKSDDGNKPCHAFVTLQGGNIDFLYDLFKLKTVDAFSDSSAPDIGSKFDPRQIATPWTASDSYIENGYIYVNPYSLSNLPEDSPAKILYNDIKLYLGLDISDSLGLSLCWLGNREELIGAENDSDEKRKLNQIEWYFNQLSLESFMQYPTKK
ncbi:MAG: hypothetical protein OHK0017_08380 [Patescibacteria group bacterium]